jgi:hypothetical protein
MIEVGYCLLGRKPCLNRFVQNWRALAAPTIADDRYVAEAIARNAIIWDVRPADAYAAGHIAGRRRPDLRAVHDSRGARDRSWRVLDGLSRLPSIDGTAGAGVYAVYPLLQARSFSPF